MSLPTITFMYITAGQGNTGTSGQQLADYWTANFDLIKQLLVSLDEDLQHKVSSDDIISLKVEDGIAYFTTDGTNWISLGPSFANLSGAVEDNDALVEKFSKYVTIANYNNAVTRISTLESNVAIITGDLETIQGTVNTLYSQMNDSTNGVLVRLDNAETALNGKISSSSVAEIRQTSNTYIVDGQEVTEYWLQYRLSGSSEWVDITGANTIEWSNIIGDITENAALMNQFDIVNDAISDNTDSINDLSTALGVAQSDIQALQAALNSYATISALNSAVADLQNQIDDVVGDVTTLQTNVGNLQTDLTNLDTTLSNRINVVESEINVVSMESTDYEGIAEPGANTIYMLTDVNQ